MSGAIFISDNLVIFTSILLNKTIPIKDMIENFFVRFDRETGNLLKTDLMGKVLTCHHGFRTLEKHEACSPSVHM